MMLQIVHIQQIDQQKPSVKSRKEQKIERAGLLVSNQTFEDKKSAEKLFADRLQNIKIKKLKLGL